MEVVMRLETLCNAALRFTARQEVSIRLFAHVNRRAKTPVAVNSFHQFLALL
jgi:hypothetical protein